MPPIDDSAPSPAAQSSGTLRELVIEVLERLEREGPEALETVCRERPEWAPRLRARIDSLRTLGLVEPVRRDGLPERIGDFRLQGHLGAGAMGVVYAAIQESLDREVALKLIRPDVLHLPGARERFARETEVIARLQHPGIVPIYTVGGLDELPYYVMERVQGCTLESVLAVLVERTTAPESGSDFRDAVLAASKADDVEPAGAGEDLYAGTWEETCLRIVRRVADALDHAHGRSVLHRDIKPSNVMLTPDGRVMLVDFGLSRSVGGESLTRSNEQVGSLAYMAPELIEVGARAVDARSDIYSLGVTLYHLLTLRLPFVAPSNPAIMVRILDGRPAPVRQLNPRVSWETETVCLAAFERDPARRYSCASDLARDLTNALERRPIEARRAGAVLRTRRLVQRHPAAALAVVLTLLLPTVVAFLVSREAGRVAHALTIAEDESLRANAAVDRSGRAIRTMLLELSSEHLDDVPGVDDVRDEVLAEAYALYLELLEDEANVPRFGLDAGKCAVMRTDLLERYDRFAEAAECAAQGRAWLMAEGLESTFESRLWLLHGYELGVFVAQELSDFAEAERLSALGEQLAEELIVEHPNHPQPRYYQRGIRRYRALADRRAGHVPEGIVSKAEFERLRIPMAGGTATDLDRDVLAQALYTEAAHLHRGGRYAESVPLLEESVALFLELWEGAPGDEDTRQRLAKAAGDLASAEASLGDLAAAEDAAGLSIMHFEGLVQSQPDLFVHKAMLSTVRATLGRIQLDSGQPEEALESVELAVSSRFQMLEEEPDHAVLHSSTGSDFLTYARVQVALGESEAALESCERASGFLDRSVELRPKDPDIACIFATLRSTRAHVLLSLDRPDDAASDLVDVPTLAVHRTDFVREAAELMLACLEAGANASAADRFLELARERGDLEDDPLLARIQALALTR